MNKKRNALRCLTAASAAVIMLPDVVAQYDDVGDDVVMMNPFVVDTSKDIGYLSTNSTSGTSLDTELKDLPMSVQVINQDFINDLGATSLEESLAYNAGVNTSDNAASTSSSNGASATRGSGGGNKSISAAGGGRFSNTAYIRGLSVPYQNRMGFRYGGLVVTTNTSIALGGLIDSVNVDRMEVVKGPNSLLYGVGVLTGIVNIMPEKPKNEFGAELKFQVGSDNLFRVEADITGPVSNFILPGELNYRIAGSYQDKDDWTDYKSTEKEYAVAQLEYDYERKFGIFLEYQYGFTRAEGIGDQWLYDRISSANDSEFRNEYDEAYNWARYDGQIDGLYALVGGEDGIGTVYIAGASDPEGDGTFSGNQTTGLYYDEDSTFVGGGMDDSFRITGGDTYAERKEWNLMGDAYLAPFEGLTLRAGYLFSKQETNEFNVTLRGYSSPADLASIIGLASDGTYSDGAYDQQLRDLYDSGQIYGSLMQDSVRDLFGLATYAREDSDGDGVITTSDDRVNALTYLTTDDLRYANYWWEESTVKSESRQWRASAVYTFETPFLMGPAKHTFLAGLSYINDQIDFPDGDIDLSNARSNVRSSNNPDGLNVDDYNNDALYFRSIADFSVMTYDGENTVRDGDLYLGQDITQRGNYFVYQGKYFDDKLELIWGIRHDKYNSTEWVYDRLDLDNYDWATYYGYFPDDDTRPITSFEDYMEAYGEDDIRTAYGNLESGDAGAGYYGALRGNACDDTYGMVPGTFRQIFDEDVEVTTHTFALNYDITDSLTIYGVLSEGVSPNTALKDGSGEVIDAERTENKEIGLKFDFWDGKLSGSISYFEINHYNNIWNLEDFAPYPAGWMNAKGYDETPVDVDLDQTYSPYYGPDYDYADDESGFVREYVKEDYLIDYFEAAFGDYVGDEGVSFSASTDGLSQALPSSLFSADALGDEGDSTYFTSKVVKDIESQLSNVLTTVNSGFVDKFTAQAPFSGGETILYYGMNFEGFDEVYNFSMLATGSDYFNPMDFIATDENGDYIIDGSLLPGSTDQYYRVIEINSIDDLPGTVVDFDLSSAAVLYQAFMDRTIDKTKNELLQWVHPIRYRRFDASDDTNNNVSTNGSSDALVPFDEVIKGYEADIFITPNENWQFVLSYSHVEREAVDTFYLSEWQSVDYTESNPGALAVVEQFNMTAREYGWAAAGIDLAWVDVDAFNAIKATDEDGIIAYSDIDGDKTFVTVDDSTFTESGASVTDIDFDTISNETFVNKSNAGQQLVWVDQRGNIINEYNGMRSSDYSGLIDGASLSYNPEDEFKAWAKYTFTKGVLDNLSVNLGMQYTGKSATSVKFYSVSPLNDLTVTPEVAARISFDAAASYRFDLGDYECMVRLNVYNLLNDSYDVTTKVLGVNNPITGESVTKRTETYYSPRSYKLGFSVKF